MVEKFSARLKYMLNLRNIKASELAEQTGIGKPSISFYLNDKCLPKQQRLFQISRVLNCNPAFLMGIDDDYKVVRKRETSSDLCTKGLNFSLSDEEMDVVQKYRQLDTVDKEEINVMLDFKLSKLKEKEKLA